MQSLSSQLYAFIVTVLIGFTIGVFFDFYRVSKKIICPRKIFEYMGDFLFWVVSTVIVFIMLLIGNWGELRLYVLIGIISGALIYFKVISPLVIKLLLSTYRLLKKILEYTVKALKFILFVITYPFFLVKNIIVVPIGYLGMACTRFANLTGRHLERIFIGPVKNWTVDLKNAIKRKLASLFRKK